MMNAFVPIIPNAFAVVFWLIAPSITADVVERLKGKIQAHLTADKQAAAPTNALSINQMDNYVPWASDLVQVPPAGLLPVAGAVIGLVGDLNGVVAVIIIFASVIAHFFATSGSQVKIRRSTQTKSITATMQCQPSLFLLTSSVEWRCLLFLSTHSSTCLS